MFHLTVGSKPLHPDKKMNAWENLFYVVTLHDNFPFEAHLSAHILWQSLHSPSLQGNFVKMILSLVKGGKKPLTYRFRKRMHQIRLYIIIISSSSSSSSSFTSSSIIKNHITMHWQENNFAFKILPRICLFSQKHNTAQQFHDGVTNFFHFPAVNQRIKRWIEKQ